jgi:hypothetical protein
MLLIGVKESNGWLSSRWNLTYSAGWKQICKAAYSVYDYYNQVEILVDGAPVSLSSKDEILQLKEAGNLVLRGISTIVKVPLMITFYSH